MKTQIMQDFRESVCKTKWLTQAKVEARKHVSLQDRRGRGVCVLFILDFSESMRGEGIRSLKRGVTDILNEFSKHPQHDENVAVIVFGAETKFLQYYSNNYGLIKQSIENLEPSGPSPLTAAFLLALGGLYEESAHISSIGDFKIVPIIVLFTDGRLTPYENEGVQENKAEQLPGHSVLAPLFSITDQIGNDYPIYCFPVGGNPNHSLLSTIATTSNGGKVLEINKARCFGRFSQHYVVANTVFRMTNRTGIEKDELRNFVDLVMSEQSRDDDDLDRILELLNNRSKSLKDQGVKWKDSEERFFVEKHSSSPTLGTRVRRGPHWTFQNQDSEGVGTIVGHGNSAGKVYVEWDTGVRFNYCHGPGGIYEVVVCDEPRIPEDGFVAVGCFVRRGPDWKWEDQDGGVGTIGTVYRVKDDATVYVRWPFGRSGNYRFGYDGKFDIEACDPFSPDVIKAIRKQQSGTKCSDHNGKSCNDFKGNISNEEITEGEMNERELSEYTQDQNLPSKISNKERNNANSTRNTSLDKSVEQQKMNSCEGSLMMADAESENNFKVTGESDIQMDSVCTLPRDNLKKISPFNDTEVSRPDCQVEHEDKGSSLKVETLDNPHGCHTVLPMNEKHDSEKRTLAVFDMEVTACPSNDILDSGDGCIEKTVENKSSNKIPQDVDHSEDIVGDEINRCWQWLDSSGVWIDYPDDINNQINYRLQQRPTTSVLIHYNEQRLRVVVSKSIQINTESKERTKIRWKKSVFKCSD